EIKFRAWDTVLKIMVPSFDNWIDFDGNYWTTPDVTHDTPNTEIVRGHNYILMQFTGLHDKNGKEICEGDIIKLIDDVGEEIIVVCEFGTVRREIYGHDLNLCDITGFYFRKEDGKATFPIVDNYAGKHDLELMEVIGDIYENPELLDP